MIRKFKSNIIPWENGSSRRERQEKHGNWAFGQLLYTGDHCRPRETMAVVETRQAIDRLATFLGGRMQSRAATVSELNSEIHGIINLATGGKGLDCGLLAHFLRFLLCPSFGFMFAVIITIYLP